MRADSHRLRVLVPGIAILAIVFNLGANCGPSGPPHELFLDTPITGTFTNDATVLVTGHVNRKIPLIEVNGVPTPLVNNEFSTTVALDPNLSSTDSRVSRTAPWQEEAR